MSFEYTPEITDEYLKNLQRPIIQQGAVDIGKARGEALRRGMTGDPFEALRVGAAQNTMNTNLAGTNANLRYNVAGLQREERMGTENFNRQSAFTSAEAEKERAFTARMAAEQRAYQEALERAQERAQRRSFWPNLISNVASTGAGIATGKWLIK